jgi:tetratricopeptide (TPR) repeat protein
LLDARQIGRDLNVRYVLEGSIQHGEGRMRVNVQLIEAESGKGLWADRFDKSIVNLLELQDQIVSRLASTLNAQLICAEAHRAEQTPEPDSLDLCFQGLACANKSFAPQNLAQARDYFERSLSLDDSNIEALVGIGMVDAVMVEGGAGCDLAARAANAEAVLRRASALAPDHTFAHYWLGTTILYDDRAERAISQFERALALSPSMASAHAGIDARNCFLAGRRNWNLTFVRPSA